MTFDRSRSAGFLVNNLARLFATALHRRIKPLGLAPAQFMTLLALWEEDGLTQSELVRRLDVEQATMANTLARMERDGLVSRRPLPGDARAQSVHLTQRAHGLKQPATEAARSVNEIALAGLAEQEREQLLRSLNRAIEALHAAD